MTEEWLQVNACWSFRYSLTDRYSLPSVDAAGSGARGLAYVERRVCVSLLRG